MASHYFLKFADEQSQPTDILGASRDAKHPGWIEIVSFSWGVSSPSFGSGTGSGKSSEPKDLHFGTEDSAASVAIARACSFGKHYPTVVFDTVADGHGVIKLVMSDAYVATFQTALGMNGPVYQFSLNTPSVEWTLFGQEPTPTPAAPVIVRPPPAPPRRSWGNTSGGASRVRGR